MTPLLFISALLFVCSIISISYILHKDSKNHLDKLSYVNRITGEVYKIAEENKDNEMGIQNVSFGTGEGEKESS